MKRQTADSQLHTSLTAALCRCPDKLGVTFVHRTICGDACPLSCISAEAYLVGWPNARGRRDGEVS